MAYRILTQKGALSSYDYQGLRLVGVQCYPTLWRLIPLSNGRYWISEIYRHSYLTVTDTEKGKLITSGTGTPLEFTFKQAIPELYQDGELLPSLNFTNAFLEQVVLTLEKGIPAEFYFQKEEVQIPGRSQDLAVWLFLFIIAVLLFFYFIYREHRRAANTFQ